MGDRGGQPGAISPDCVGHVDVPTGVVGRVGAQRHGTAGVEGCRGAQSRLLGGNVFVRILVDVLVDSTPSQRKATDDNESSLEIHASPSLSSERVLTVGSRP